MQNPFPWWLTTIFVLLILGLLVGGGLVYQAQYQQVRRVAESELASIAELKVAQIVQWRADRLADGIVLMDSPLFIEGVARWMTSHGSDDRDAILTRLRSLQQSYHYHDALLIDADGNVRLALDETPEHIHPQAGDTLAEAFRQRRSVLTDLHAGPGDIGSHLDVVVPLFPKDGPSSALVGTVILRAEAADFLYPLIQTPLPINSRTAETLLVRQDGDSVLFLNELRHREHAALNLRIERARTDVPAIRAVFAGQEGVFRGTDYRGVEVLSVLRQVPDSPWFMVAKVDVAEAFATWNILSLYIVGLTLGLVGVTVTAGFLAYKSHETEHYRSMVRAQEALRQSEERYRITLLSIGDGVITTDAQGRVDTINAVAEDLTGWSQEDSSGRPLEEVFRIINEETRRPVESPAVRVLRDGIVVGLGNHTVLISRSGSECPIADSAAPIRTADGGLSGMVLVFRDQTEERALHNALETRVRERTAELQEANRALTTQVTERKRAEEAVSAERKRFVDVLDSLPAYVVLLTPDYHVPFANKFFRERFGESHGKRCFEYLFSRTEPCENCDTYTVLKTHAPHHWEWTGPDGHNYDIHDFPFTDVDGSRLILEMGIDITERKQMEVELRRHEEHLEELVAERTAEVHERNAQLTAQVIERERAQEALRNSEEKYRSLFEGMTEGFALHEIVCDDEGKPLDYRFLDVNPAFERLTGLKREDVIGRTHNQVLPTNDPVWVERYGQVALTGEPAQFEEYSAPLGKYYEVFAYRPAPGHFAALFMDVTERKKAEQDRERLLAEVQSQRALLDTVIEHLPVGIGIAEAPSGKLLRVNEEARRIWRLPNMESDDAAGYGQFVGYHPDGRQYAAEDWQLVRALKGEVIRGEEVKFVRGDGTAGVMRSNAAPVRDEEGNIAAAIVAIDDITREKETEEAVKRAKDQWERTFDSVPDLIAVLDDKHHIVRVNKAMAERLGCSPGECVGLACHKAVHGTDHAPDFCPHSLTLTDGLIHTVEVHEDRLAGDFLVSTTPLLDSAGKMVGSVHVARDISQRKRIEQELRDSQRDLNRAQTVAHTGSWRLDVHHDVLLWSEEAYRIFGIPLGTPLSYETFLATIYPDDRAYVDRKWNAALHGEPYDIEHRILVQDGVKWVRERAELEVDAQGRLMGGFGTVQDITVRKQTEEALRLAHEELEMRVRERTSELLTANEQLQARTEQLARLASELTLAEQRERRRLAQVLHDHLQQLLVGAKFGLELLDRRVEDTQRSSVKQIQDLVSQSIQASRSLTVELSPPILHEEGLVAGMEWLSRWMNEKQGLVVKLDLDGHVSSEREDVRVLVFQAVRELLFNVVKHAGVTQADLQLRRDATGDLRVVVHDDGVGFDPQGMWTSASAMDGGFGLFSIRERLGLLGGHMTIDSAPERGTSITIVAPTHDPSKTRPKSVSVSTPEVSDERPTVTPAPAPKAATPRIRVLMVDDHVVMRQGLSQLLRSETDIEIVGEASDGQEAVARAAELLPDVVLMDSSMPGMDGVEATRLIHAQHPEIRIIGLSMYEEADRAAGMLRAGAAAYLTKSDKSGALLSAIRGRRKGKS